MEDILEIDKVSFEEEEEADLMLTSNEDIDAMKLFDSTIEIIGYVDGIEAPRYVGDKKQFKFFKFYVNNGSGKRVQIVAWNDEIHRIENEIKPNIIIHLDGVQSRIPKMAIYNNGNVPFELHIRGNTVITALGTYEPSNIILSETKKVEIKDILNTSERVILEGFIKSNFGSIYHNKLNKKIGCGSITDGEHKIEIHILNFDEDKYLSKNIKKGDKIQITGTVQNTADPPYLLTTSDDEIKKLEGRMSLGQLIKGVYTPKKRKMSEDISQVQSKKVVPSTF